MFRSKSAVGISRVSSQQSGYDSAPYRLQSGGNKSPLSLPASTSRRICPRVVSAHRETDGIHTGHISGSLALPISSAPETPSPSSAKRVRCNNSSVQRSQGRASLVVSPPRCMEWSCPAPNLVIETDASRKGWGAVCQGVRTGGVMVPDGAHNAHQLLGTVSRFIRSKEFCKGSIMCPCETSHGQHFGCSLCEPPRGNTISSSVQFGSGPIGVGSQSEYFSKCRTPCRTHKCYGRLAVSSLHRFEQLAVMPRSLSGLMQIRGPCAKDLFADRLNTQLPRFYSWKPDPMAVAVDAL